MSESRENPETDHKKKKTIIKNDSRTGLPIIVGPSFTKEDVARDFPDDSDRDSHIIRKSVGL